MYFKLKIGDVVVLNTEKDFGYSFQNQMTIIDMKNEIATCQADILSEPVKYHIDALSVGKPMPK